MKSLLLLTALSASLLTIFTSCKKKGCMDTNAENYSEKAKKDDGSCTYLELTGTISSPTTIAAGKTIKICGDLIIESDLILSPGVTVVMCADAGITVQTGGSFSSLGSSDKPVTIKGEQSTKGYWREIYIKSNNPSNKIQHTVIKDGGAYYYFDYSTVYVNNGASLSMTNSTISNSKEIGLYIYKEAIINQFSSNTFSSNGTYGLKIGADNVQKLDVASNYNSSNGLNYIAIRDQPLNNTHQWKAISTPYLLLDGLTVNGDLTLNPGVNIRVEEDNIITVNTTGSLNSNGTASQPISIRGKVATNGYWYALYFKSNNTNNVLNYTKVTDGGGDYALEHATLATDYNARLNLDNSTVSNSYSWGVYSWGDIYTNNTLQNTESGVTANNTLTGNGVNANSNCTNGCTIKIN